MGLLVGEDEALYAIGGAYITSPGHLEASSSMHILLPDYAGGSGGKGWTKAKDLPQALLSARAHWINGSIVVVGRTGTGTNPTMVFELETREWHIRANQPGMRAAWQAGCIDGCGSGLVFWGAWRVCGAEV